MGVHREQGGCQGGYTDEALWDKINELQDKNSILVERLEIQEGVLSGYRDMITSLGTVIEEKDAKLDQVQGKLAEGFECFQRWH